MILGRILPRLPQQRFEMAEIVVPEYPLFGTARPDPGDHRGVVFLVRQNEAIRQQPADRAERRFIGHIAGREHEGGLLAMQIGKLRLERDNGIAIAGDVAGTPGAGAHPLRSLDHGIDDSGMASHPEIVVRAPYHDLAGGTAAAPGGIRRAGSVPLEINKVR